MPATINLRDIHTRVACVQAECALWQIRREWERLLDSTTDEARRVQIAELLREGRCPPDRVIRGYHGRFAGCMDGDSNAFHQTDVLKFGGMKAETEAHYHRSQGDAEKAKLAEAKAIKGARNITGKQRGYLQELQGRLETEVQRLATKLAGMKESDPAYAALRKEASTRQEELAIVRAHLAKDQTALARGENTEDIAIKATQAYQKALDTRLNEHQVSALRTRYFELSQKIDDPNTPAKERTQARAQMKEIERRIKADNTTADKAYFAASKAVSKTESEDVAKPDYATSHYLEGSDAYRQEAEYRLQQQMLPDNYSRLLHDRLTTAVEARNYGLPMMDYYFEGQVYHVYQQGSSRLYNVFRGDALTADEREENLTREQVTAYLHAHGMSNSFRGIDPIRTGGMQESASLRYQEPEFIRGRRGPIGTRYALAGGKHLIIVKDRYVYHIAEEDRQGHVTPVAHNMDEKEAGMLAWERYGLSTDVTSIGARYQEQLAREVVQLPGGAQYLDSYLREALGKREASIKSFGGENKLYGETYGELTEKGRNNPGVQALLQGKVAMMQAGEGGHVYVLVHVRQTDQHGVPAHMIAVHDIENFIPDEPNRFAPYVDTFTERDLMLHLGNWPTIRTFDSITQARQEFKTEAAKAAEDERHARVNPAYRDEVARLRNEGLGTDRIDQFAAAHNMTRDEYLKAVGEHLQKLVDGADIYMRRTFGRTNDILKSGEFRTQFETKSTTTAADDTGIRRAWEHDVLDVSWFAAGRDHTRYGYLSTDTTQDHAAQQYGSVAYRLKSGIRSRTTVTFGDSLNNTGDKQMSPEPIDHVSHLAWSFSDTFMTALATAGEGNKQDPLTLERLSDLNLEYVEAQFHGQVTLDDVAEVVFHGVGPTEDMQRQLESRGISYRVESLNNERQIPTSYSALEKYQKIDGPHGSQEGQWYRGVTGHEFYVKPAQDKEHAMNEVGAMAAYAMMGARPGIDIPHVDVLSDGHGKYYVVSQKMEGVQTHEGDWWRSDEAKSARAQAMKLWGADVLLSHWDVAGSAHDNMLTSPDGKPVRIEAGGAMGYRARGEGKPSWKVGAEWHDPWTMRGIDHGDQRGNRQDGAIFGHMTDEQAYKSLTAAAKKLDLGKLARIWESMGMGRRQIDDNIRILQDRILRISKLFPDATKGSTKKIKKAKEAAS